MLVNNAGLAAVSTNSTPGSLQDWEEMIDTNVKGLLYVSRAVVPGMVRVSGHVVNLGSTAGELTYPNGAVYCATKAAERAINDGLRLDLLGTPGSSYDSGSGNGGRNSAKCASGAIRKERQKSTRALRP